MICTMLQLPHAPRSLCRSDLLSQRPCSIRSCFRPRLVGFANEQRMPGWMLVDAHDSRAMKWHSVATSLACVTCRREADDPRCAVVPISKTIVWTMKAADIREKVARTWAALDKIASA